jgi:hypothetical protein
MIINRVGLEDGSLVLEFNIASKKELIDGVIKRLVNLIKVDLMSLVSTHNINHYKPVAFLINTTSIVNPIYLKYYSWLSLHSFELITPLPLHQLQVNWKV